jgi:hypothetical protein
MMVLIHILVLFYNWACFSGFINDINTHIIQHSRNKLTNGESELNISLSTTFNQTIPPVKSSPDVIHSHKKSFFIFRMDNNTTLNPIRISLERTIAELKLEFELGLELCLE